MAKPDKMDGWSEWKDVSRGYGHECWESHVGEVYAEAHYCEGLSVRVGIYPIYFDDDLLSDSRRCLQAHSHDSGGRL
jgi:hypothetical protein